METPLEISFHNLDSSPALEAEIRKRVAKLERIYDRLIGCRVSVEAPHKQHRTGNVYEVHIEMRVPKGPEIVVTREPHRAKERYANPDVRTSLRDAFKAAEVRLKSYKEQLQGEVKQHPPLFHGRIAELVGDRDFGFLLTAEGQQLYFHRDSVMNGGFDQLKPGDTVHYIAIDGDTGPYASKVWLGPDHTA
jgi:ribosome-associated translation inhibitor RaiA/cold shock CspA family protein